VTTVRLGRREPGGIAPAVFAMVERGLSRRPGAADGLSGEVELRFTEGYPPVRLVFGGDRVVVEDGAADAAEAVIEGPLPELVRLTTAPLVAGVPNPAHPEGRAAWRALAGGRVRVAGRRSVGRRVLALLAVEG